MPPYCEAIAELLGQISRLEAKLAAAIDEVNHRGEWELEGAASMAAWLRYAGSMSGGAAVAMVSVARCAAEAPVTAAAWESGELSTGQVRAIAANVGARRVELFARHEADLVSALCP